MLENLYFWKRGGGGASGRKTWLTIIVSLLLIGAVGAGGWYYFVMLPAQKAREEMLARQRQAAQKLQNDIASVNTFYTTSLQGASIEQTIKFLTEVRMSSLGFNILNLEYERFKCDIKNCSFGYQFRKEQLLVLPQKTFWNETYKPSVPANDKKNKDKNDFEFKNIASKLNVNSLQKPYKNKEELHLYPCEDVVSYILTYNSFVKSTKNGHTGKTVDEIVIKGMPKSSVSALEPQLTGKVKPYGLMAGKWELEVVDEGGEIHKSIINMQKMLLKQAYRDAFLIKQIESTNKGIKVSGGLVCKS